MQSDPKRIGWKFGALWTLASAIGYGVGGAIAEVSDLKDWWYPTAAGWALIGCVGGLGQWLVLRTHISRAAWWILANAAGWFLGMSAGRCCSESLHTSGMLSVTAFVLLIASLQWLVLRRKARRALSWIIVSGIATWLASFTGMLVGLHIYPYTNLFAAWAVGGSALGLVFGVITAWPLIWLLRNRDSTLKR